jgi:hypothetical protein
MLQEKNRKNTLIVKVALFMATAIMVFSCSNAGMTGIESETIEVESTDAVNVPLFVESGTSWNASSYPSFVIDVVVKKIAYHKQVTIVYSYDNWQTVLEAEASYVESLNNDYELWNVQKLHTSAVYESGELEFAVRYIVGGNTYWDNNGGSNFILKGQDNRNFVAEICNAYAWNQSGASFSGDVRVRNLDYHKVVKVTYWYDGNKKVINAAYEGPAANGYEIWDFQDMLTGYASTISWSVEYQVGGMTFFTNNAMQVPGSFEI